MLIHILRIRSYCPKILIRLYHHRIYDGDTLGCCPDTRGGCRYAGQSQVSVFVGAGFGIVATIIWLVYSRPRWITFSLFHSELFSPVPASIKHFELLEPVVPQEFSYFQGIAEPGCGENRPGVFEFLHLHHGSIFVKVALLLH